MCVKYKTADLTVQFSLIYYLSSNNVTSFKIKNEIQIHPYERQDNLQSTILRNNLVIEQPVI